MQSRSHVATWTAVLLTLASIVACSSTTSGSGSSGSSGSGASGGPGDGANICSSGPGTCRNGDSSTCRCGTSCVQTAECVGCSYECVKGCSSDSDCAGFFSGDTPPVALSCIGASSTMPVAHCGIGSSAPPEAAPTSSSTATPPPSGTPCSMHSSYDHYCSDQGYPPHFNQCDKDQTPAAGCENALLNGVSCGQGGAAGTIRDCYCCP